MNKVQAAFIIEALDNEDKLTDWEWDFVYSLADLPEEKELSDKQNEVLNRIHNKIV